MREVPECLNRRYKAVDDLIQQLSWSVRSSDNSEPNRNEAADPGIRLMCDFWDILKEDPDCDLKRHVKQRMGLTTPSTHTTYHQEVTCFNIADKEPRWKECAQKLKNFCCQKPSKSESAKADCSHCKSVGGHCTADLYHGKQPESVTPKTPQSVECSADHPLNKALFNVNNAATFESQCNSKINDLIITQLKLVQQIEVLETREQDGLKLLQKADSMWSCMEDSYKKRLQQYTERHEDLLKQMREIEASNTKWRKNKKDLENQVANTIKNTQAIDDQIAQKKTDQKLLKMEVEDFKKRIETTKTEINNAKKYLETKKNTSEAKVANYKCEVTRLQKLLADEEKNKFNKEKSGNSFVKEARQELQKICRVLLKKRLENEDRRAEKAALLEEIDLLNITMNQCKNRCKLKQDKLNEDLAKIDQQIGDYKIKCVQCNQCTDSNDIRRFCLDCPRCNEESDCVYKDGFCYQDSSNVCVCLGVKEKFLDNVFDNMYTVLERHSKNAQGKHVADSIMDCLKHSKNGKLNTETKKLLQDFILCTLRKNLHLTIIGGAVKTRCELEPETYNQLMLCLKSVTPEKVPKEKAEKATEKKDPCKHWRGRVSECHCPYGPKECVCSKKAPPQPDPPKPPSEKKQPADAVKPGEVLMCPHKKESIACGPDCNAFDALMKVGTEMSKWRPDPCSGPACSFKNVRAVQCILGPEVLNKALDRTPAAWPRLPLYSKGDLDDEIKTSCSKSCLTDAMGPRKNILKKTGSTKFRNAGACTIKSVSEEDRDNQQHFITEKEKFNHIEQNEKNTITGTSNDDQHSVVKKENHIKENSKSITGSKDTSNDNMNNYMTKLTKTSSGTLAITLGEEAINLIGEKAARKLNPSVSLNKTPSGHIKVDFNDEHETTDDSYKAFVKKTPSGAINLEVYNNKPKAKDVNSKTLEKGTTETQNPESNKDSSTRKINDSLTSELLKSLVTNMPVKVKVTGGNGPITQIKAVVTKTLSGNLAIDIHELSLLGENLHASGRPVVLNVLRPGLFDLSICNNNRDPNAVVRKTHSGKVLVVLTKPVLKDPKPAREEYFQLRIRSSDGIETNTPVVLKVTPSLNYVVIFDKEFEQESKKLTEHFVKNDIEYHIDLTKTASGNYLIRLDDNEKSSRSNAIIVRSPSGNIKIINKYSKRNNPRCFRAGSSILKEMFNMIPRSDKDFVTNSMGTAMSRTKSRSDSKLCDGFNVLSLNQSDLRGNPLSILKKTNSGQYAVVLRKECKEAFLKSMKNYLQNDSKGLIPVKRTESGEIMIMLNEDMKATTGTSLKITSSGNVYITVDENLVKENSSKTLNKEEQTYNKTSVHVIGTLERPVNKAVTTSCNAKTDSASSVCSSSNCVCKETLKQVSWERNPNYKDHLYGLKDRNEVCDCSPNVSNKSDYPYSGHKMHCNNLDHTVIQPRESKPVHKDTTQPRKPVLKNNPRSIEKCFSCLIKPSYNFIEKVPKNLIDVPILCKKHVQTSNESEHFDSLCFLAPQLPFFLRDLHYQ